MIQSFGLQLRSRLIDPLPGLGTVAAAIGVWPGDLERAMVNNQPTTKMLQRLAEVSNHAWILCDAVMVRPLTVQEMEVWVREYDRAPASLRTTLTRTLVRPEVVLTDSVETHSIADKLPWLRQNPAFTLRAYTRTFGIGDEEAEDDLTSTRFRMRRQSHGSTFHNVWRWNPLDVGRPTGRPVRSPLDRSDLNQLQDPASLLRASRFKQAIEGKNNLLFQPLLRDVVGRKTSSHLRVEELQAMLRAEGWAPLDDQAPRERWATLEVIAYLREKNLKF